MYVSNLGLCVYITSILIVYRVWDWEAAEQ